MIAIGDMVGERVLVDITRRRRSDGYMTREYVVECAACKVRVKMASLARLRRTRCGTCIPGRNDPRHRQDTGWAGIDRPYEEDLVAQTLVARGPLTLAEIGHAMGLSRERIRQIESAALAKALERCRLLGWTEAQMVAWLREHDATRPGDVEPETFDVTISHAERTKHGPQWARKRDVVVGRRYGQRVVRDVRTRRRGGQPVVEWLMECDCGKRHWSQAYTARSSTSCKRCMWDRAKEARGGEIAQSKKASRFDAQADREESAARMRVMAERRGDSAEEAW